MINRKPLKNFMYRSNRIILNILRAHLEHLMEKGLTNALIIKKNKKKERKKTKLKEIPWVEFGII